MSQLKTVAKDNITTTYIYDSAYNCISKTVGQDMTTYTHNGNDQLTSITSGSESLVFEYDRAGRMIRKYHANQTDYTIYEYNTYGQLIRVVLPNNDEVKYEYYGTGLRAKKIVTSNNNSTIWTYHYDNGLLVKIEKNNDYPIVYTYDTYGLLLSIEYNSIDYYPTINTRGDITSILDINGNVVMSYAYDEWGKPTIIGNAMDNQLLYQGERTTIWDKEISLYAMGVRFYDPLLMRFITRDFNHGDVIDTMSQNLYIYAKNNPIQYIDNSGFHVDPAPGSHDANRSIYRGYRAFGEPSMSRDLCSFIYLWRLSGYVEQRMEKMDNGSGLQNDERSVAFWTSYYNNWLSMGLTSMEGLTSLSNLMNTLMLRVGEEVGDEKNEDGEYVGGWGGISSTSSSALTSAHERGFVNEAMMNAISKFGGSLNPDSNGPGIRMMELFFQASMAATIGSWVASWATTAPGGVETPPEASQIRDLVLNNNLVHTMGDADNLGSWGQATSRLLDQYGTVYKGYEGQLGNPSKFGTCIYSDILDILFYGYYNDYLERTPNPAARYDATKHIYWEKLKYRDENGKIVPVSEEEIQASRPRGVGYFPYNEKETIAKKKRLSNKSNVIYYKGKRMP